MAEARAAWQQTGPTWDPARLVFLDESGGRTDLVRRYGRGQRGERVVDHAPDRCWHTTTLLAALRVTGLTAPAVFDGPNQGHAQCFGGRDDRNRARHRRGATGWGEERLGSSVTRLERVAGWLSDVFGIDTRSLAVFRIGLALTILLDLVLRAQDLGAHYTDAGVLPRALLAAEVGSRIPWAPVLLNLNPHFLFGGLIGQALVFVAAGATAVLLLVGWRTWWVTVASWILLASLHGRNPGVLNTGDVVLRMLLFWSMFLPLGARWSMDAARRSGWSPFRPRVVVGGAAAALLLQVGFIYAFNALFKTGAAWTTDFTALEMALGGETWASAWGQRLLEYPELLNVMTRFVIGLERYGLILAFLPFFTGPARMLAVVLFVAFHIGILVWMRTGIFPVACIVAWLVFLPTWLWEKIGVGGDVASRLRLPRWRGLAALAILGYLFLWNVGTVWEGVRPRGMWSAPAYLLRVEQRWSMFSPQPPSRTRYVVARGETDTGAAVDLLNGAALGQIERRPAGRYDRVRWRNYFGYVMSNGTRELRERLAASLGDDWNSSRAGQEQLTSVRLDFVSEALLAGGTDLLTDRDQRVQELARVPVLAAP